MRRDLNAQANKSLATA